MSRPPRRIGDKDDVLPEPGRHWPNRPSWLCDADGQDWPCLALRRHLLATRTRHDIEVEMGVHVANAVRELDLEPDAVRARLLGWVRHSGWHAPGGPW